MGLNSKSMRMAQIPPDQATHSPNYQLSDFLFPDTTKVNNQKENQEIFLQPLSAMGFWSHIDIGISRVFQINGDILISIENHLENP